MTVSYSSNRVTIDGPYKSGVTVSGSTATTIEITSGEILAADEGRLLAIIQDPTDTYLTEVRRIEDVSGSTVTLHDPLNNGVPAAGVEWRVAHNLDDVFALSDPDLQKSGDFHYWDADFEVENDGFLGEVEAQGLQTVARQNPSYPIEDGCIVQFGLLWGGENQESTQTTNGIKWFPDPGSTGIILLFQNVEGQQDDGFVFNIYGCSIQSSKGTGNVNASQFMRLTGCSRFIGSASEGTLLGRFYHEQSEFRDMRISGNPNNFPQWSFATTLVSDPNNIAWFQNFCALQNRQPNFDAVIRNQSFADSNEYFIRLENNADDSDFDIVDSTTFGDDKVLDVGGEGVINQLKSINYSVSDTTGSPIQDFVIAVYDKNLSPQGVEVSDSSGVVPEIRARFYRLVNNPPSDDLTPFNVRQRSYDYQWVTFSSSIAAPINTEIISSIESNVTQTEAVASSHTGITLAETAPVTWQGLPFSITITGDKSVNPTLTFEDIKHYIRYNLSQTASFSGRPGPEWHDMLPIASNETAYGEYGVGVFQGVRVIDENGDTFPGVTRHQSDNGTYYVVPTTDALTITSDTADTTIRYFDAGSQVVEDSTVGTSLSYQYSDLDPIDIELVKQGYVPVNRPDVIPYNGNFAIQMDFDEAYNPSNGLTIGVEFDYNRSTKVLTINSDQNALDVRSGLSDSIRQNASYFNTPLTMVAIPGLTRVDLVDGTTITSMDTWKGAGMERFSASDSSNPIEKWYSIKSVGDITGANVQYRQTDSGDSTAIVLTNDIVDEAFQYWDDPDHDGSPVYDYSDYMIIKSFLAGSRQGRVDVPANAGEANLRSNLYTVPLSNFDGGYSGTDRGISADIQLVAGGNFGGLFFSYEIVDLGANSGSDIADQLNYNAATNPNGIVAGGTGLRYFELPDMVIYNATSVETEAGFREGATPTTVGFYVSRGGEDHPDFTRFQADNGQYYTPAVTANALIAPIEPNSRLRIYNRTADAETVNQIVAGSSYSDSYTNGVEYTAGDVIDVYLTYQSGTTAKLEASFVAVAGVDGWSVISLQEDDLVYNANGIDGSIITKFVADYIDDEVDISSASNFTATEFYAWWVYNLTTEEGIREFFGGVLAQDQANYLIQSGTVNVFWDNLTTTNVRQTDSPRIYRADGVYPVKNGGATTGGGGIDINWQDKVFLAVTGSGPLTPAQDAQLFATALESTLNSVVEDVDLVVQDQGLDPSNPKTITENTAGTSYDEAFGSVTKEVRKSGSTTTITRTD